MMSRLNKWNAAALALAGALVLGQATAARATLTLEAFETTSGGATFTLVVANGTAAGTAVVDARNPGGPTINTTQTDSSPANTIALGSTTVPIAFGILNVFASLSTTNSPGAPGGSQVVSSSLQVVNTTPSTTANVQLFISANGFTTPPAPVAITATASGSFDPVAGSGANLAGDSATAMAFANFANQLFGTGLSVQNFTTGTLTPTSPNPFSYSNSAGPVFSGPGTPYSMTVDLAFALAGNNQLSGRSNSIIATAVPEPGSIALALTGLPALGLFWARRRRCA
jgi:hypothetical protein